MRHTTPGVWASGTGGTVQNSRMNNTWGDGINLNNLNDGVGNSLTATNNFIRASGDDGIAINSVAYNGTTTYAQMQNASVTYNTSIAPVWANCLRIAGGQSDVVQNNLLCDGVKARGLFVSEFGANGQPLNGANVTGNTILRCGGNAYNSNYASVDIGASPTSPSIANVTFGTNTINGCYFNGINIETLSGTNTLSNNLVNYPAQKGIYIQTGESGTASLTSNTVSNLNTGQVAYQNDSPSTFTATLTNNSWQTSPPPPPAAPTGLAATAVSSSQINLSWTATSGATSYNVKRATVSGGPYTTIATGVTATSYTDATAVNGTTYFYVVSAVNAGGESANSAQVSATPSAPTIPAAPTGLVATGAKRKVNLSWNASTGATSYNAKRAAASGGPYTTVATGITTTTYTDTGLTSGPTYYYVDSAVNGAGESLNSNQASATAK